jgi:hypothetical protein
MIKISIVTFKDLQALELKTLPRTQWLVDRRRLPLHARAMLWCEPEALAGFGMVTVCTFADQGFPAPMVSVYEARIQGWAVTPA